MKLTHATAFTGALVLALTLHAPAQHRPFPRAERMLTELFSGPGIAERIASWRVTATLRPQNPRAAGAPRAFDPRRDSFDGTNHSTESTPGGFCAGISALEAAVYEYAVKGRTPPGGLLRAVPELATILAALEGDPDPGLAAYMAGSEEAARTAKAAALKLFPAQDPILAARGQYGSPDPEVLKERIDEDGYALLFFGTKYKRTSPWYSINTYYANGGHAMLLDSYKSVMVRKKDGLRAAADFFHAVDSNFDETEEDFPDFGLLCFYKKGGAPRNLWSWMGSPEGEEHIEMKALDAYQEGEAYHDAAELLLPPRRYWEEVLGAEVQAEAPRSTRDTGGDVFGF